MNNKLILAGMLGAFMSLPANAQVKFEDYFMEKTMRFDFYHAGNAQTENFYFDEIIEEPYWAGNKRYLVDDREMGNQMFKVIDKASGKVIYSRGYSTLFSEWQATPEAKTTSKAMPEGVVFPYPKTDVTIEFYSRSNSTGKFSKKFTYDIDVDRYFVRKSRPSLSTIDIHYTGNPAKRVEVVLIAEGNTDGLTAKRTDETDITPDTTTILNESWIKQNLKLDKQTDLTSNKIWLVTEGTYPTLAFLQ